VGRFAMAGLVKKMWLVTWPSTDRSTPVKSLHKSEFQQVYSPFVFLFIFRVEAVNGRSITEALPMDIDE
jgi:hypothetical protein